jgi:hypothetical protein
VSDRPYASCRFTDAILQQHNKALQGLRIAIVREHMVNSSANHVAISDQVDRELKTELRDLRRDRVPAVVVSGRAAGL